MASIFLGLNVLKIGMYVILQGGRASIYLID